MKRNTKVFSENVSERMEILLKNEAIFFFLGEMWVGLLQNSLCLLNDPRTYVHHTHTHTHTHTHKHTHTHTHIYIYIYIYI